MLDSCTGTEQKPPLGAGKWFFFQGSPVGADVLVVGTSKHRSPAKTSRPSVVLGNGSEGSNEAMGQNKESIGRNPLTT